MKRYLYNGKEYTRKQLAEELGIPYSTLRINLVIMTLDEYLAKRKAPKKQKKTEYVPTIYAHRVDLKVEEIDYEREQWNRVEIKAAIHDYYCATRSYSENIQDNIARANEHSDD